MLSRVFWGISALEIGFPKLVGDIGEVFHHPTLAFPHFTAFSLLFLPALERGSRAIEGVNAARRVLRRGLGSCPAAVGVDVLRIHLGLNAGIR